MAVTKTLGPLDFEDLVRELVYDFNDWQSIEATGRSGIDDGFDILAYERVSTADRESEERDSDEDDNEPHPMEGNLWMFQCKREAEIGPTKVGETGPTATCWQHPQISPRSRSTCSGGTAQARRNGVLFFCLQGANDFAARFHQENSANSQCRS